MGKPDPGKKAQQKRTVQDIIDVAQEEVFPFLADLSWERLVLGAVLLNEMVLLDVVSELTEEDFSTATHRIIFNAICQMSAAGTEINIVTLVKQLQELKLLEVAGGVANLSSLTDGIPIRPGGIKKYLEKLKSYTQRRRALDALVGGVFILTDPSESAESALATSEARLIEAMAGQTASNEPKRLGEFYESWNTGFQQARQENKPIQGLSYGIAALNEATTGLRNSEVTVVGGRPGTGKSSFALQCSLENAEGPNGNDGVPVYYASAEMSGESLFSRTLSRFSRVNNLKLRSGKLELYDLQAIDAAFRKIDGLPFWIDDCRHLDIDRICGRIRAMRRRVGIRLGIFDYAQIIKAPGRDMQERTAYISHAVADLARSEKMPCVLLSQIGRTKEKKGGKDVRPTLDDLKWSGALEEDADVVVLLYRGTGKNEYLDEAILAKQRNGPTGPQKVRFDPDQLQFFERT